MNKTSSKLSLLIVDDDIELLRSTELLLRLKYDVTTTSKIVGAKDLISKSNFDAIVVDLSFEGQEFDGIHLLDWVTDHYPQTALIVLSADKDTERVVKAMKRSNLVEFIPKSRRYIDDLQLALNKVQDMHRRNLNNSDQLFNLFPTNSETVKHLLNTVQKISKSKLEYPILITGETGTGKEYFAKYIAACLKKKIVSANMAAISKDTAESELFGHTRGAFTGATQDKMGLITSAHQGIFFLDEIGECNLDIQAKLLRIIQEKEVIPVGAVNSKKLDVQFIAATNRNLQEMIDQGFFRLDLLNRINTITLHLPALRERREDIEFYFNWFLKELSDDSEYSLRSSGLEALLSHDWLGNLRELKSFVARLCIFADTRLIDGDLVNKILKLSNGFSMNKEETSNSVVNTEDFKGCFHEKIDLIEKSVLHDALSKMKTLQATANYLGLSKSTLQTKLKKYTLPNQIT